MQSSTEGILLFESTSLTPIYANDEAICILAHTANPPAIAPSDGFLAQIVQPLLKHSNGQSGFVNELRVGESVYSCQAFLLATPSGNSGGTAGILLVLIHAA